MTQPPSRRRASTPRTRLDATVLAAVLAVGLTAALTSLVGSEADTTGDQRPEETPLSRAAVVCPSGSEPVVFSAVGASGEVQVGLGNRTEGVSLRGNRSVQAGGRGDAQLATGTDEVAAGLLAGRFERPLASAECGAPQADQWFTGVGAGARHRSVLELVNPDAGRAIVDVAVYGRDGVVEADDLRGLAVPGRSSVRVDLSTTVPRRDELTLRVSVNRGRVSASLFDRFDRLGGGSDPEEWLPSQLTPAASQLLLGLPEGAGRRTLVLTNPGKSQTRAAVRLVTPNAVLTPEGAEDITVPPESTVTVRADRLLSGPAAEGAVGLVVDSDAPVTATLRSLVGGDLAHSVSTPGIAEESSVLLPAGDKQVVLAGATGAGTVALVARGEKGDVLARRRVEVLADRGYTVGVPDATRRLDLTPQGTTVAATVAISGDGEALVRLREPQRTQRVPGVRPALP